jgi:hypothetical protein
VASDQRTRQHPHQTDKHAHQTTIIVPVMVWFYFRLRLCRYPRSAPRKLSDSVTVRVLSISNQASHRSQNEVRAQNTIKKWCDCLSLLRLLTPPLNREDSCIQTAANTARQITRSRSMSRKVTKSNGPISPRYPDLDSSHRFLPGDSSSPVAPAFQLMT